MVRGKRKPAMPVLKCTITSSSPVPQQKSREKSKGEPVRTFSTHQITGYFHVKKATPNLSQEKGENSSDPIQDSLVVAVNLDRKVLCDTNNQLGTSDDSSEVSQSNQSTTTKTETSGPLSPSTTLSRLNINGSKKPTKSKSRLLVLSETTDNAQKTITQFFPIRRSSRKPNKTVLEEKRKEIEDAILSKKQDGLQVKNFEAKGRGVVTTKRFLKGEFVVEYAGDLISIEEAKKREATYAKNENIGCYMYYFKHQNNLYCVDATEETDRLGRLLNHSKNGNLITKTMEVNGIPRLVLLAKEDIEAGCELTYDYGDRSKQSLQHHPWLAH